MFHEFSFPMPINPGLQIDQSQTPDEFGAFGCQWYAQVEKHSTCVALDTELQLPYGMGRLDADNTFTDDFLPLNPGSEYPLYSDLFKAPSPADPFGMEMNLSSINYDSPDSAFTFDLQACGSPPFLGVGWPQSSSPLDTFQHFQLPSGHFQSHFTLPYGEAETRNNPRFKQAPVASPSMTSSEFDPKEQKFSAIESAIRRMARQWEGQMSSLEASFCVMTLLRATGLDRRMQMKYKNRERSPGAQSRTHKINSGSLGSSGRGRPEA